MTNFIDALPSGIPHLYLIVASLTALLGLLMYLVGSQRSESSFASTMRVNKLSREEAERMHRAWKVNGARLVLVSALWPMLLVYVVLRGLVRLVLAAGGRG